MNAAVSYHQDYYPPFPVLTINLHDEDERLGPFTALIDSGSDVTLVPLHLLEQIGAAESGWVSLRGHFGASRRVQRYLIGIQINDLLIAGLYVVADDIGDEIIVGRDVLNKLPIFLDGPEQQTELLDDSIVKRLRSRRKE